MEEEDFDAILRAIADDVLTNRFTVIALVQYLVDRRILKGKEEAILKEIKARAADLRNEASNEAWLEERVRKLREAWNKLPKQ